ncbi:MAG: cytochrome C oxidase subunit IV family protein [Rhizobacter sp.]|nr:cytochrome C oxidase subunit IV family protein [Rhizobacter sp.]
MNETPQLHSQARSFAIAWLVLLALMLTSLATAYLDLGAGNAAAGLAIAFVKSAIVLWLFMRLRTSSATVRIVAAVALATLAILATLSGIDYATRRAEPAAFQPARQVPSLAPGKPATNARR